MDVKRNIPILTDDFLPQSWCFYSWFFKNTSAKAETFLLFETLTGGKGFRRNHNYGLVGPPSCLDRTTFSLGHWSFILKNNSLKTVTFGLLETLTIREQFSPKSNRGSRGSIAMPAPNLFLP